MKNLYLSILLVLFPLLFVFCERPLESNDPVYLFGSDEVTNERVWHTSPEYGESFNSENKQKTSATRNVYLSVTDNLNRAVPTGTKIFIFKLDSKFENLDENLETEVLYSYPKIIVGNYFKGTLSNGYYAIIARSYDGTVKTNVGSPFSYINIKDASDDSEDTIRPHIYVIEGYAKDYTFPLILFNIHIWNYDKSTITKTTKFRTLGVNVDLSITKSTDNYRRTLLRSYPRKPNYKDSAQYDFNLCDSSYISFYDGNDGRFLHNINKNLTCYYKLTKANKFLTTTMNDKEQVINIYLYPDWKPLKK